MKTPPSAVEWLKEKCEREHWSTVRESRVVTRKWVRHTGGRVMRAALSGSIAPSAQFDLSVQASGVEPEYVAAIKNAAFTVLLSQGLSPVLRVNLSFNELQAHLSESSYGAFYAVAHEVVSHLIGVAPGTQHNIEW